MINSLWIFLITEQQCSAEKGNPPEENGYELLDCYYSSPEDAKARLSHLLERVTTNSIMNAKFIRLCDLRTRKRTFMATWMLSLHLPLMRVRFILNFGRVECQTYLITKLGKHQTMQQRPIIASLHT